MSPNSIFWIASIVGGAVGVFFFYIILETVIFKRIADDPVVGKLSAVAAAWVVASLLYGFNTASSAGFVMYLPGAMLVAFYAYKRGLRIRSRERENVEATFE